MNFFLFVGCQQTLAHFSFALGITVGSIITKLATNAAGEDVSAKDATGDAANLCHDCKGENLWKWDFFKHIPMTIRMKLMSNWPVLSGLVISK